jgi:hypothetical protein
MLATAQAPQGAWVGSYGADGYALLGWNGSTDLVSLGSASLILDQGTRYQWRTSSTQVRDLQSPDGSTRRATAVYDANQLRLHLTFTTPYTGTLHLYALDASSVDRREVVTLDDGSGPRTATLGTAFDQGMWVHAPISVLAGGSVTITIDRRAGYNAVLSGIFLGGPAVTTALTTTQAPQGSWVGTYGADGYALLAWNGTTDLVSLGAASLVIDQGTRFQWRTTSTALRDLQSPDGATRRATAVYDANQLRLHLTFTTAYTGTLHLYALDASTVDRREVVTVDDGSGPRTATLGSPFDQGIWIHAPISVPAGGSVTIIIDRRAGYNAVLSGLFLN